MSELDFHAMHGFQIIAERVAHIFPYFSNSVMAD